MQLEESRISLETVDPRPLASDLVVIYREAYRALPQYAYHGPREIREYLEWLWRRAPEGFLVAFAGDQAVGFLAVDYRWRTPEGEETGELHELAVHPEHQGQGIGRRLLREGIALLERRGAGS